MTDILELIESPILNGIGNDYTKLYINARSSLFQPIHSIANSKLVSCMIQAKHYRGIIVHLIRYRLNFTSAIFKDSNLYIVAK